MPCTVSSVSAPTWRVVITQSSAGLISLLVPSSCSTTSFTQCFMPGAASSAGTLIVSSNSEREFTTLSEESTWIDHDWLSEVAAGVVSGVNAVVAAGIGLAWAALSSWLPATAPAGSVAALKPSLELSRSAGVLISTEAGTVDQSLWPGGFHCRATESAPPPGTKNSQMGATWPAVSATLISRVSYQALLIELTPLPLSIDRRALSSAGNLNW